MQCEEINQKSRGWVGGSQNGTMRLKGTFFPIRILQYANSQIYVIH